MVQDDFYNKVKVKINFLRKQGGHQLWVVKLFWEPT